MSIQIYNDDCLIALKKIPDCSLDSLVTDPPAGIAFMGKDWDKDRGGRNVWIAWMTSVMVECYRVLKPGAHGLVWSIPRTSHWTGTALENAGFEIRDQISHIFGTGFPKSLDVSKAIDKTAGVERDIISTHEQPDIRNNRNADKTEDRIGSNRIDGEVQYQTIKVTAPATDAAKQWQGWGTALKPSREDWWLVRKPCSEKTVAANVQKWGTGAINIDGGRIGTDLVENGRAGRAGRAGGIMEAGMKPIGFGFKEGRFPSHTIFDEAAAEMLDEQVVGRMPAPAGNKNPAVRGCGANVKFSDRQENIAAEFFQKGGDPNKASRFFYVAKASKADRGDANSHPTVKSTKLMEYLIKLITPPSGTVLDPFMGSGSTGVAAEKNGFKFVGIEQSPEYFEIAKARVKA